MKLTLRKFQNLESKMEQERANILLHVFTEFLSHLSNLEKVADIEKLLKVIFEEEELTKMDASFLKLYREKLFHTNLSFFEKAVEKAKFGNKANKIENRYLQQVSTNLSNMQIALEQFGK